MFLFIVANFDLSSSQVELDPTMDVRLVLVSDG